MFNKKSRTQNFLRNSTVGISNQIFNLIMSFIFRTIFLLILSKEYLGLDSLFATVLALLSITELGIGSSIIYRLYGPVREQKVQEIAKLMNFFKIAYRIIFALVLGIGLAIMPFIRFFIKDMSEVPSDVNIYIIYSLFLLQSCSSYLFSYKQSILLADQKSNQVSYFQIALNVIKYGGMLSVLLITKNYTYHLVCSIVIQITCNFLFAQFITRQYKEVFAIKDKLTKIQKKEIYKDIKAILLHRIGGVCVNNSTNILIGSLLGIGVLGVYANYSMLTMAIMALVSQMLVALQSALGNLHSENDIFKERTRFMQIIFAGLWLTSFCTIGLLSLSNTFILTWKGTEFLLDISVVAAICASFFMLTMRLIVDSFVQTSGLFRKDQIRPIIMIIFTIGLAFLLSRYMGLVGIFIAQIIGVGITEFWRAPHLIHKYNYKMNTLRYWVIYIYFILLTVGISIGMYYLQSLLPVSWPWFAVKFIITLILPNLIILLAVSPLREAKFFLTLFGSVLKKFTGKKNVKKQVENVEKNGVVASNLQAKIATDCTIKDEMNLNSVQGKEEDTGHE